MKKTFEDIFVTFSTDELEKMLALLADWCDDYGHIREYLNEAGFDQSDLFEQFRYLMEVREVALQE